MLDFEGESAPYCQYGYARGRSILRKAEGIDYSNADFSKAASDEAYSLVKQINGFGDAVKDAADKNEPFYITDTLQILQSHSTSSITQILL